MSVGIDVKPLEERVYRYKQPFKSFYCPLCRTKRSIIHNFRLTKGNFFQIFLITIVINICVFPFTGAKGLFFIFPVWGIFEFVKRSLFKKEIACPHCGFDASWYKRDVTVAKKIVADFWIKKDGQNSVFKEEEKLEAEVTP